MGGLSFSPRFHWADDVYQFQYCHPCLESTGILAESIYCGFSLITWVAGAGRFHLLLVLNIISLSSSIFTGYFDVTSTFFKLKITHFASHASCYSACLSGPDKRQNTDSHCDNHVTSQS